MFTVLIAEKEHIDAIQQENELFFEPFLESKELAFCHWNPNGQSLDDSVPGLLDTVGRQEKWRAIIINPCKGELLKSRNPFDVVDDSVLKNLLKPELQPKNSDSWDSWENDWKIYHEALTKEKEEIYKSALTYPLQKLSTWLCYRPEDFVLNEVQEKQDVHDWALHRIGQGVMKPTDRLEMMEREQYKCELRMKEALRKTFIAEKLLNVAYPTEVHCISLRCADSTFFDPDNYWHVPSKREYSTFVNRNMYFDKMRFMVFDLLPRTHRNFKTDYIRFLASVLVFASNPVPISAMQARYLYQLESEADDSPFCTLVTSYDKKLAATLEVIHNEMEKIRNEIPGDLTDKDVEEMLSAPKDVAVVLDETCNLQEIYVDKDYGLFFDYPENEHHKWNAGYSDSRSTLSYIVKQQTRSIKKSVEQARLSCEILDVDVNRLTPFQIDDIREYTNNIEDEMIASMPQDITDISQYTERLEKDSKNVKKVINRRMTRKTTATLFSSFLGLFFLCFVPFLFSNRGTPKEITTAISLTGAMLGLLALVMVITLFFLRISVLDAVQAYNETAKSIINDIHFSLKQFSEYLSASCNVRRGHAIQNHARENLDKYTKSLRIRQKHQEDIRKRRAYLVEHYCDYLGDKVFCDEIMAKPYDYDFDQRVEYLYPAPHQAGDSRQIEFISSGNFVRVPTSFIKRISVRMEEIYER